MKKLKQLVLPCYKVELAMDVEAWYFLYGTTCGVCNLTYFISLLSRMTVAEAQQTKRGLEYALHPGQADGSMLSLAKDWGIGRKAVSRLLEDFERRKLIRTCSNPMTTLIDMVCVKSWMKDGQPVENPTYRQTLKAYEGVRIYLFNGQKLETLRKSSTGRKKPKNRSKTEETEYPTENPGAASLTSTNNVTIQPEKMPPPTKDELTLFNGTLSDT